MDENTQLHAETAQNCQCGIWADETAVLGRDLLYMEKVQCPESKTSCSKGKTLCFVSAARLKQTNQKRTWAVQLCPSPVSLTLFKQTGFDG